LSSTTSCPFCSYSQSDVVLERSSAYVRYDAYPVTPGHMLVIPKRYVASLFDLGPQERRDVWELVEECKDLLDVEHHPDGYNIGVNVGTAAGQTIFHCHIHVIPRYRGDSEDPTGGVRGVIPSRQKYPRSRPTSWEVSRGSGLSK